MKTFMIIAACLCMSLRCWPVTAAPGAMAAAPGPVDSSAPVQQQSDANTAVTAQGPGKMRAQCGGFNGCNGNAPCADAAWTTYSCAAGNSCQRWSEFFWLCIENMRVDLLFLGTSLEDFKATIQAPSVHALATLTGMNTSSITVAAAEVSSATIATSNLVAPQASGLPAAASSTTAGRRLLLSNGASAHHASDMSTMGAAAAAKRRSLQSDGGGALAQYTILAFPADHPRVRSALNAIMAYAGAGLYAALRAEGVGLTPAFAINGGTLYGPVSAGQTAAAAAGAGAAASAGAAVGAGAATNEQGTSAALAGSSSSRIDIGSSSGGGGSISSIDSSSKGTDYAGLGVGGLVGVVLGGAFVIALLGVLTGVFIASCKQRRSVPRSSNANSEVSPSNSVDLGWGNGIHMHRLSLEKHANSMATRPSPANGNHASKLAVENKTVAGNRSPPGIITYKAAASSSTAAGAKPTAAGGSKSASNWHGIITIFSRPHPPEAYNSVITKRAEPAEPPSPAALAAIKAAAVSPFSSETIASWWIGRGWSGQDKAHANTAPTASDASSLSELAA